MAPSYVTPFSASHATEIRFDPRPVTRRSGRLFTVTVTVFAAEVAPAASVTVSEKVSVVSAVRAGAVNVGLSALAELSVTVVPAVWLHE